MRVHDVEQRGEAWRALRLGKVTGSRAKAMLSKIQKGEAAGRRDLRMLLITERLTQQSQESDYVNADMIWGTEHEVEALACYEALTGSLVSLVGFVEHDDLPVGTSPDGFVGDDGILSLKCPRSANHWSYLRDGVEPGEHVAQNTHELWLTGRAWLDFVSYDPRFPISLQLFCVRVTRTAEQLDAYDSALRAFLAECDTELQAVKTMADLRGQLTASVA
jgi:hypothetical protein